MARTRKDVWKLGDGWSDELLWYARAVRELQGRGLDDRTSWRYLAALHGFHGELWEAFGYYDASDELPPEQERRRMWDQCQHGTWYFLPWHRGYLAAFEAIVLDAVVKLGGPGGWALPYWDYSDPQKPRTREMPRAFGAPTLPDGSPNPLLVPRRYGPQGDGRVMIPATDVKLERALQEPGFAGLPAGGSPGFGGPETQFEHGSGASSGMLEARPHNLIHVAIGGFIRNSNPNVARNNGLMSMPATAALDPVFWLHHANIDRLWEVWLRRSSDHSNPEDTDWLDGPADRSFEMPRPDGGTYVFTARSVLDTTAPGLGYDYEDVSDPLGGTTRVALRLRALGAPSEALSSMEEAMVKRQPAELVGANDAALRLEGGSVDTQVRLDRAAARGLLESFSALARAPAAREPDRVFLNLENIRGANDAVVFDVYVGLPPDAAPQDHPEFHAGSVSLFGVSQASRSDGAHAGNGLTEVLEITHVIDALGPGGPADLGRLGVRFVPRRELRTEDQISVERVSVYRQGS